MEATARTQTAFRLKNQLLERLKWQARKEKKSLNNFVEEILEETVGRGELEFPKLPKSFFQENRPLAERYVLKGVTLPKDYEGKDGFEQADLDKEMLMEALYEENL